MSTNRVWKLRHEPKEIHALLYQLPDTFHHSKPCQFIERRPFLLPILRVAFSHIRRSQSVVPLLKEQGFELAIIPL
jgi:hypothetical protein